MDKLDRSILSILQENARISNVDLADRIGLSASACLRRVAQLEKDGLITGYHANLSLEQLGHSVLVLVNITLQGQSKECCGILRLQSAIYLRFWPVFCWLAKVTICCG